MRLSDTFAACILGGLGFLASCATVPQQTPEQINVNAERKSKVCLLAEYVGNKTPRPNTIYFTSRFTGNDVPKVVQAILRGVDGTGYEVVTSISEQGTGEWLEIFCRHPQQESRLCIRDSNLDGVVDQGYGIFGGSGLEDERDYQTLFDAAVANVLPSYQRTF